MKVQDILTEATATRDEYYRKIAVQLYDRIVRYFYSMDEEEFWREQLNRSSERDSATPQEYAFNIPGRTFSDIQDVPFESLNVVITPHHQRSAGSGRQAQTKQPTVLLNYDMQVIGDIRRSGPRDVQDNLLSDEGFIQHVYMVRGILDMMRVEMIHELIHWLDEARSDGYIFDVDRQSPRSGSTDYINDPIELNTFYQEAMVAMDKEYETVEKMFNWEMRSNDEMDRTFDRMEYFGMFDFETFFELFLEHYKVFDELTPENQRKIRMRAYQQWERYKERFEDHTDTTIDHNAPEGSEWIAIKRQSRSY